MTSGTAGPPMGCDTDSGTCPVPRTGSGVAAGLVPAERAAVVYVTDPICSGCWALEPAWRKLRHHHWQLMDVRHVYGGLLPRWEGFADRGAGITAPTHVAPHWAGVAARTGQPINPAVWQTDRPHRPIHPRRQPT
jgi:putative protein-disulfide isomerase